MSMALPMDIRRSLALVAALLNILQVSGKGLLVPTPEIAPPTCMCPPGIGLGNLGAAGPAAAGPAGAAGGAGSGLYGPGGPNGGNVEIITLDAHVANAVRSQNASVAAEIAKLMHVPVTRVAVTPLSWPLSIGDAAPQGQQAAFVQEEHKRCDCTSHDGKVVQDQGFTLTADQDSDQAAKASNDAGAKLASDTSIMTVSQFNAMNQDAADRAAEDADASAESPARIQLLTHDSCLTEQLISNTAVYTKMIAGILGVPETAILVHPPPVKGTVGLLQVNAAITQKPMSLLAVKCCNTTSAPPKPDGWPLSLLWPPASAQSKTAPAKPESGGSPPPPKPAGWPDTLSWPPATAGSLPDLAAKPIALVEFHPDAKPIALKEEVVQFPGMPKVGLLPAAAIDSMGAPAAAPAASPAGAAPPAAPVNSGVTHIVIPLKFSHVNYDQLASNAKWGTDFTSQAKTGIVAAGTKAGVPGLSPENIEMALYPDTPGSTAGEARVKLPPLPPGQDFLTAIGGKPALEGLRKNLEAQITKTLSGLRLPFIDGIVKSTAMTPTMDSAGTPNEQNRAWIAPWSIVVLPPFAKQGSQKMLEMIATPGSPLAKLLPQTVAYVPGSANVDRSLGAQNGAPEARLPPPLPKSVGLEDPNSKFATQERQEELERAKYEQDLAIRTIDTQAAHDIIRADAALKAAQETKAIIDQAGRKFLRAARAHAEALRPQKTFPSTDIANPSVLAEGDMAETPYSFGP